MTSNHLNHNSPEEIPLHHSPVRHLFAENDGCNYVAFKTLEEAKLHNDTALIMEADSGGQILMTCPTKYVVASEEILVQLLCDLESITWGTGEMADFTEPDESAMYYEIKPCNTGVAGGMGGGVVIDGIWVHKELEELGLKEQIKDIILGKFARLSYVPTKDNLWRNS